jgi:hypothetical protein
VEGERACIPSVGGTALAFALSIEFAEQLSAEVCAILIHL